MLRVDNGAGFITQGTWFWKRHRFSTGKLVSAWAYSPTQLAELEALQRWDPVPVSEAERRRWWWFRDRFYWDDEGMSARDVKTLVVQREHRAKREGL